MATRGLRRLMAVLGVVAGLGITHAEAADKVKVGFSPEPYAPFWIQDASGKWSGFEVELIDALFKQMARNTSWCRSPGTDSFPRCRKARSTLS